MDMTTDIIRQKFLTFFASKGHKLIKSDSLVPKDDPTVLFTTAGMQQFKRQFLGNIDDFTRASTSQKCLRTDDLDQVGKTDCHHTFFEMLGNFSFGDYFKKDAIHWAWEFLTKEMGIAQDRLWVSVYQDDAEAEAVWLNEIKVPADKIFKLGDKSNFWPSNARLNGPNGPCGPCSEIFFDYEPQSKSIPKDPDDEPGRFTEVWNLVFTQFNRKDGGVLEPLPSKNIDTGMGLERLVAVMQGKKNNFDIDLFVPIMQAIRQEIEREDNDNKKSIKLTDYHKRVIADHMRAVVFGINDGVIPSNEGRGYVIKKLIVTMSDIAILNGRSSEPVIYKLVPAVVDAMKVPYPELENAKDGIQRMIKNIEMAYIRLRAERIPEFEEGLVKIKAAAVGDDEKAEMAGELMFRFRDTYGLTIETMKVPVINSGLDFDKAAPVFERLMKEQQEKSRAGSKMTGDVFANADLKLNIAKTNFLGYTHIHSTSEILKIVHNGSTVPNAQKGDEIKICLDKTPFYAESGGQVGDIGTLTTNVGGRFRVTDTQKIDDVFLHIGVIEEGSFRVGDHVHAEIDINRRMAIMRNHTATHLLQAALREVLGKHVQQQGSVVDEQRLRFDFTHPKALTDEELYSVEKRVNEMVLQCETVTKDVLSIEEAKQSGALAFFAEKYGETVRVISIGNLSREFCGGTHLDITGQIGLFKIVSETAIAQGIRRIEAKTGLNAFEHMVNEEEILNNAARLFKVAPNELSGRIQAQAARIKELEKSIDNLKFENVKSSIDAILAKPVSLRNGKLISHIFKDIDMNTLRKVTDLARQKSGSYVNILASSGTAGNDASVIIDISEDMVRAGVKANEIIKEISPLIEGSGGGRPQMAQAGGKNGKNLGQAVDKAIQIIKGIVDK
jgi:alanyl-tRNA synthetase